MEMYSSTILCITSSGRSDLTAIVNNIINNAYLLFFDFEFISV